MRMFVACRLPHVALRAARRLPFAAWRLVLAILFGRCRLPLASRLCRSLLAASPWHLLLSVRVALSAAFCERSLFLLSPHAESRCASYRRMLNPVAPPIAVCRTSAAPLWR